MLSQLGKARKVIEADNASIESGKSALIITYGRGVYWSLEASKFYNNQIEILDLRTLNPLDEEQIYAACKLHSRILIVTEEPSSSTFSLGLAGSIQKNCFEFLDAPVEVLGSKNTPAIPLNEILETEYLPNAEKVKKVLSKLFEY